MIKSDEIERLKEIARLIRIDILKMLHHAGSGHTGGSLSAVEILTALYFSKMRHNPRKPDWEERDRFILSKGHAAPALYATLARAGYFPRDELKTLRRLGSRLQGHPDMKTTPGVEVSTGSLGQGLSMGNGLALSAKIDGKNIRVYVLMGDGEQQEGQVWEAAMTSSHYKIDNLCGLIDRNGLQIDGPTKEIMDIDPLFNKWKAFGWYVLAVDGHNLKEILEALNEAERIKGAPTMIIASTIKGKGVSIFENKVKYHGVAPNDEELEIALKELGEGD